MKKIYGNSKFNIFFQQATHGEENDETDVKKVWMGETDFGGNLQERVIKH